MKEWFFPNNVRRGDAWFLIIFLLTYLHLFGCVLFHITLVKYVAYLINVTYSIIFLFYALRYKMLTRTLFEKMAICFYLLVWTGLVIGITDGQKIDYALKGASSSYLLWGVFFYLRAKKYHLNTSLNC